MRAFALPGLLVLSAIALFLGYSAIYVVSEREQAIQMRFGEIQRVITEPGIYLKLPTHFVDTVQIIDKRLLTIELADKVVQVTDGRRYVVDAFATFRITNPQRFREAVTGNVTLAAERLRTRLDAAFGRVYGKRSFDAALSAARAEMMVELRDLIRPEAAELGMNIVDVRIRRTDLVAEVSQQTFARMRSEREAEAAELRARGTEEALRIRAEADRQATVLVAEARRDADILRGEGEAEMNRIFADAFGRDKDFFNFYRSMQAYRQALGADSETTLILSPDSSFFRYFNQAEGTTNFPPDEAIDLKVPSFRIEIPPESGTSSQESPVQ